jgi:hypothetical protein
VDGTEPWGLAADNALGGVQRQAASRPAVTRHSISRLGNLDSATFHLHLVGTITPLLYLDFPYTAKIPRARRISRSCFLFLVVSLPADAQPRTLRSPDTQTRSNALGFGHYIKRIFRTRLAWTLALTRCRKSRFQANSAQCYAAPRATYGADILPQANQGTHRILSNR